ncbi:hypothetical protein EI94DRAFT_1698714 [Lactarius quietus]|nr:hypothetical protein EI94DRAFT_1698714 [Lactarius quietus]
MWIKVTEKFNQEHHMEWPECGLNSLKKKFMEFKSSQMKDQQISELLEKLDKRCDEIYKALNLQDLSAKDPEVLENLARAFNHLGLPLPSVLDSPPPTKHIQ